MQTFLPYPSYLNSAQCLDMKRLGKQRVEAKQIFETLKNGGAWENHPAVKMWRNWPFALCLYGAAICREWRKRGYQDTLFDYFRQQLALFSKKEATVIHPPWLTNEFCSRHRAALLAKNWDHYGQFGWSEKPGIDYLWPTGSEAKNDET